MIRYLLWSIILGGCSLVQAEEFNAKVIAVMDGDTVMVLREGKKIKVRLVNIDAPESEQEFGRESRESLANLVLKKQVQVNTQAVDSYGRMIAEISLDGQSVNEAQVNNGMAWEYSHYHRNQRYIALNKQAQQARRGLWAKNVQPVSPEKWRKAHPKKSPAVKAASAAHVNAACGKKHLCSQMISCEEAKTYFLLCGVFTLDGNGDGVPCESLCVADTHKLHQMK
jgi:endonuclease YncB( thermonuclease family)